EISGSIDATGNIDANSYSINGTSFGAPPNCGAAQKLEWDGGWSCVADLQGGSGGGAPDLQDVLSEGNDANNQDALNFSGIAIGSDTLSSGDQDLVLDVTGAIGADWYCDSDGDYCFTSADVGSQDL